jgi:pimeloyl-ACP methyl ester carboxylesterase
LRRIADHCNRDDGNDRMTTAGRGADEPAWTATGPETAPAIVFIHGTLLTRAQWEPQVRRLSGAFRCIAVDLPAHGTLVAEPFSLEAAAAAVAAAIDAAAPRGRAVLVGLSLGGYVAIETAARFPDRVNGLVLAGCSAEPVGPTAALMRFLAGILEHVPGGVLRPLAVAGFRVRYRRAVAQPILAGGLWFAGGAGAIRTLIGRRFLDRLGRLWVPVMILNGALDPVFGPGGDIWSASCRQGRRVVMPWAGHLCNLDRPTTFAAHVAGFARDAEPGA